jgi:hypothetical protein
LPKKEKKRKHLVQKLGIAMAGARSVGSLPVPNVQALAEICNDPDEHIPERYIRPEASSEEVINNYQGDMAIPIIDLKKLLCPQSSEEECVKLRSACQYWGFFLVCNFRFLAFHLRKATDTYLQMHTVYTNV